MTSSKDNNVSILIFPLVFLSSSPWLVARLATTGAYRMIDVLLLFLFGCRNKKLVGATVVADMTKSDFRKVIMHIDVRCAVNSVFDSYNL